MTMPEVTKLSRLKQLCLVSIFFGPIPKYFPYFLLSAKLNSEVDFIIFSDQYESITEDMNVKIIPFTFANLAQRVSDNIGMHCQITQAWKLCDIKPLFGLVFLDFLSPYDFWGFIDIDIVWGSVSEFVFPYLNEGCDFYSSSPFWTSGHCSIMRNTDFCNKLPLRNPHLSRILADNHYYAFEEVCQRWFQPPRDVLDLVKSNQMPSFYDIICEATRNGEIVSKFDSSVAEFIDYKNPFFLRWRPLEVLCLATGRRYMYFHLIVLKKIWKFYIPPTVRNNQEFIFTRSGIRGTSDSFIFWFIAKAIYSVRKVFRFKIYLPLVRYLNKK